MCDGDWAKSEDESSIYSDEYDSIHTFTSAQTWVEKRLKMTAETRENLRVAAIRASEYQLDGPIDRAGNANTGPAAREAHI